MEYCRGAVAYLIYASVLGSRADPVLLLRRPDCARPHVSCWNQRFRRQRLALRPSVEARVRRVEAIGKFFARLPRCTAHLSHLSEVAAGTLNCVCYVPCIALPSDPEFATVTFGGSAREARGLARLHAAPELFLGCEQDMLIERNSNIIAYSCRRRWSIDYSIGKSGQIRELSAH